MQYTRYTPVRGGRWDEPPAINADAIERAARPGDLLRAPTERCRSVGFRAVERVLGRPRARAPYVPKSALADAEFRGFFLGEGNVDLAQQGNKPVSIAPRARVSVRADDLAILEWAKARFGGCISHRAARGTSEASCQWQLTGSERIHALLDVLEGGYLPSRKRSEFALLREAASLVGPKGQHADPAGVSRRLEIRHELQELKRVTA